MRRGTVCLKRVATAGAARGEEEPVHKDAVAVVFGVEGEETVPLVLLFAPAVSPTALGSLFPVGEGQSVSTMDRKAGGKKAIIYCSQTESKN